MVKWQFVSTLFLYFVYIISLYIQMKFTGKNKLIYSQGINSNIFFHSFFFAENQNFFNSEMKIHYFDSSYFFQIMRNRKKLQFNLTDITLALFGKTSSLHSVIQNYPKYCLVTFKISNKFQVYD